ncbi:MAG: SusD/RagB family nutrient-binding outer membrane lipoprotein, partial [Muribaculaceae bacterium]
MKIKKYLLIGLVSLIATSCSEDAMDSINKDTHNPPAGEVPTKFQITDGIVATAFSTSSGLYAWY